MTTPNITLAAPKPTEQLTFVSTERKETPAWKRATDILLSFAFLVLLLPILLVLAVAIKLDSKGPVFFRQFRIGLGGIPFTIWKLRSMKADVSPYAQSPNTSSDPRLTRVGRLIRRISVDELPQLWNVLRGDMSLVGPRPEMPYIVEHYSAEQRMRLAIKPGITGLWQISHHRSSPIHENLQHDLYYIKHCSMALDFSILIRTIFAVARGV
ncbi:MAG TPA: sugar transferase [Terriglobales bacterium]|nr:sugar transferase [Terriglobales bacterium]